MSKHTPGPWQWDGNPCNYDKDNEAPWLVTDAYAVGVEKDLRRGVVLKGSIDCLNEANARLIAAAPTMYEALKAAEPYLRHANVAYNVYVQARAAIAKAEGA